MKDLLNKYQDKWNLSQPKIIAKTPTSHVFKVIYKNNPSVLKIYTELGRKHEAIGPEWLTACKKSNAVIDVFYYDENACLIDYVDGEELLSLVDEGKDDDATIVIAQTLNKIHALPIPNNHSFKTFKTQFHALINHDTDAPDIIHRAKNFLQSMTFDKSEECLLHGDTHHKNIMHHSTKGWLMLDPQALVGDRAYDCANTLHNPHQKPELTEDKDRLLRQAKILGQEMCIDPQRIIDYAYIHGCLSSCWTKMDDGEYCQLSLNTSKLLEPHITKEQK